MIEQVGYTRRLMAVRNTLPVEVLASYDAGVAFGRAGDVVRFTQVMNNELDLNPERRAAMADGFAAYFNVDKLLGSSLLEEVRNLAFEEGREGVLGEADEAAFQVNTLRAALAERDKEIKGLEGEVEKLERNLVVAQEQAIDLEASTHKAEEELSNYLGGGGTG